MSRLAVPTVVFVISALVMAGCSGSVGAATVKPASSPNPIPTQRVSAGSPSAVGDAAESTACMAPRDPVAPPEAESIAATIPLGCEGGAVAVGGGSVWVVPHLDRVALQVDPVTNTVTKRI